MRKLNYKTLFLAFLLCSGGGATAQTNTILIQLGPDEIGENQPWTISITVQNDRLKSYDNFPEIDGFKKRGSSTQSQTSMINGQISSSQGVIMTYFPLKQGTFTIPPFKMKVNDQVISVAGKKVRVGPPVQQRSNDPFRSFFDRDPATDPFARGEPEFVEVKEDALLALTTSKDEVYVGEGFTTTLSFLVADNNRAHMQFYELGKQLSEILKKLRPTNCWEENFNIENIESEQIEINGKGYSQYKIYQATFYPLNTEPVTFPSVGLEMIKFKEAKNPSFFGQNRKEDYKTFYSKVKTVKVRDLPPHPLRDAVSVGNYRLEERLNQTRLTTGQSVSYDFTIVGEGNISSIEKPTVLHDNNFEIYEPNVKQNLNRESGRVAGNKSFSYFMIPKEPGTYQMADYFQWVFFNPNKRQYDTLRSQQVVEVTGESHKNMSIESTDAGSFYDQLDRVDNTLRSRSASSWMQTSASLLIIVMVGLSSVIVFRKK